MNDPHTDNGQAGKHHLNRDFEAELQTALHSREKQTDPATVSRLAAVRREALDQADSGVTGFTRPAWAAVAAALLIAVITAQIYTPTPPSGSEKIHNAEIHNVQVELYENLEMLEYYEELEFLEWLETEIPGELSS